MLCRALLLMGFTGYARQRALSWSPPMTDRLCAAHSAEQRRAARLVPPRPASQRGGIEALYNATQATSHFHTFLGLLAKIKCSICSYQFNIWYVGHALTLILNLFFVGEGPPQWLATGALACRPAVALLAGPGAPQPILKENLVILGWINNRPVTALCNGPLME
jgi:hypothetical protein